MPDINDPDPLLYAAVEDGEDMAPRQCEDRVDAFSLEGPGDDLPPWIFTGGRLSRRS